MRLKVNSLTVAVFVLRVSVAYPPRLPAVACSVTASSSCDSQDISATENNSPSHQLQPSFHYEDSPEYKALVTRLTEVEQEIQRLRAQFRGKAPLICQVAQCSEAVNVLVASQSTRCRHSGQTKLLLGSSSAL